MATTTKSIRLLPNDWTLIADGVSYQAVTLQLRTKDEVMIFVGTSEPTDANDDVIFLDPFTSPVTPTISLAATDKIYGSPVEGDAKINMIRVSV